MKQRKIVIVLYIILNGYLIKYILLSFKKWIGDFQIKNCHIFLAICIYCIQPILM